MTPSEKKFFFSLNSNTKMLLFIHLFVIALVTCLFYSLSNSPFSSLDKGCFQFVNGWIQTSHFWQIFWAMANHRGADILEDICFILFFYWIIKATPKAERTRKIAECLFFLLYCASIILIANELLFRVLLHIERKSPTLIVDSFTNLSEKVTWLKVKFKSPKSFPGDHATTALLFITSFIYLARNNIRITVAAILYGIFLCLPRLVVGAHWITDILVGSGSISLIFFSWAFFTPLASTCIKKIENVLGSSFTFKTKKKGPVAHDI